MKTVSDLFDAWPEPKVANVARDLSVTTEHAAQMKNRGSIPVKYWPDLVTGAARRGIDLDYATLVEAHAERAA